MSDTSLIFNLVARDTGLGRVLGSVADKFRSAGREAEDALDQAGSGTGKLDAQIGEVERHLNQLNQEFARTGDTTLFGKMSRDRALITQLQRVRKELADVEGQSRNSDTAATGLSGIFSRLGGAAAGLGGTLAGMGGNLMGVVTNVWNLVAVLAIASAASFAMGGAIGLLGGAAASLPGLLSGAIAAIATLKLGLFGLGENWKAMNTASGGGGGGGGSKAIQDMTPKLRAVEAAQRAVTRSTRDIADAQRSLREATEALNDAREDERERIEDVRRSLASARADEADSVQSLAEARMALSTAEARGNPDEIRRAQIAVDKQAASLEEAKDKTQDLQKESDEAARKGVEGSDAVVSAKKREQDAQRRVQDAVEQHKLAIQQLGDAQKALKAKMDAAGGSAGGLAAQIPKISKSAKEFLDVLKSLQPAFEDLRLSIQEKLFAGLGEKLQTLANVWIPQLKVSLGSIADTINGVVKTAFDSLSKPSFVSDMAVALEGFNGMLGKIGQAVAGPLVDAWGRLSRASTPFMDMLGDKIAGIITRFSEWIAKIDESGKLSAFFEKAAKIGGDLFDIFEDLGRIAGSVISILFGSNLGSTDAWDNLATGVDKVADWFGDPQNQEKIRSFLDQLGGAAFLVMGILKDLDKWIDRIKGWKQSFDTAIEGIKNFFTGIPESVTGFFSGLGDRLAAFPQQAADWLSSLPDKVWTVVTAAMSNMAYSIGWGIGTAGRALAGLPRKAKDWLKDLPGKIKGVVDDAVGWFKKMGSWAYDAVKGVPGKLWNALIGLPALMWAAGYNAVIGLWNGVVGLKDWLWSKVKNLGVSMYNAFMEGIGAHSPSRKFADAGMYAVQGAVLGLENNRGALLRTARDLAADLAAVPMGLGLDEGQLTGQIEAAATGTVQVAAARRQPLEVRSVVEIVGDGPIATMLRKAGRTRTNIYKTA